MALTVLDYQDTIGISARSDRQLVAAMTANRSGIINGSEFVLTAAGSPTAVNCSAGYAVIKSATADQGSYFIWNDASASVAITSNGTGSARVDTVYLNVRDHNVDGSGFTDARILVSTGAASGGNLVNLNGSVLPSSGNNLILGFVVVPASSGTIINVGGYRDPNNTSRGAAIGCPPQFAYGRPAGIMPAAGISTANLQAMSSSPTTLLFNTAGTVEFDTHGSMADLANSRIACKAPGIYVVTALASAAPSPNGECRVYANNATTSVATAIQSAAGGEINHWWGNSGTIRCGFNDNINLIWEGTTTPTIGTRALQIAWVAI